MGGIASETLRRAMNEKMSQYSQQRPQNYFNFHLDTLFTSPCYVWR